MEWQDMTMYLVLSAFTSSPISVLETTRLLFFLYSMYVSAPYIIFNLNESWITVMRALIFAEMCKLRKT
jgi:hypothetical protein